MSGRRRIRSGGAGGGGGDVNVIAPGATDQTIDAGNEDNELSNIAATLNAQDLGSVLDSLSVETFTTRTALGNTDDSLNMRNADGSTEIVLGGSDIVMVANANGDITSIAIGATSDSGFIADSTIFAQQHGTSATQTGTDWTNPTNATGKDVGTFAEIAAENTTLGGDTYSSTLQLETYGLGLVGAAEPTGFTRSGIELKIYHAMKPNINALDLLSTLSHDIEIHNGITSMRTLESWDDNSADFTSPVEVTYSLTDLEFQTMQLIQCNATCNLSIGGATTSSVYWRVYYAAIEITYVRSGIE